jgi:2Fe-2S ferredoxin
MLTKKAMYYINFRDLDGTIKKVEATIGLSILEIAHKHDIAIEGACGGALACSTCHVMVAEENFQSVQNYNKPSEEEEDLLDTVFDLQPNSRLCCQIIMRPELDGATFILPKATRNILLAD